MEPRWWPQIDSDKLCLNTICVLWAIHLCRSEDPIMAWSKGLSWSRVNRCTNVIFLRSVDGIIRNRSSLANLALMR